MGEPIRTPESRVETISPDNGANGCLHVVEGGSVEMQLNSHRFLFLPKPRIRRGFKKGPFCVMGLFIRMIGELKRLTRKGWKWIVG
ncbi:hypothetical protein CEXT_377711 [Caerostris extrusa]|uniref:Uncharacterized protein n=1 Tax=Caerostris extrusa TaxID=172846 RepID=A0AAV4S5E5_CAEEX|nr:hypothetical protein CEXT_377711 [Caerostris extrusa]